ncbi:MAG: transporter substrate-binding domain-containing protein [Rhizobacter sp.]|nr:transporter substrate-binding domain-containing protein [Bacteriovorax sp.]
MYKYLNLFLLGVSLNAFGAHANPSELHIVTFDIAPFSYFENNELKGYNIDILKQLEKSSGLKFNYEVLPYERLKLFLKRGTPDLLINLRALCLKNSKAYEVQEKLYETVPAIFVKKGTQPTRGNIRVGRLLGTCGLVSKKYLKNANIVDLPSLDQAVEMLVDKKIDSICGLGPVVNYSLQKRKFSEPMVIYKSQTNDDHMFDAVLCRKKSLSPAIKKQLEQAARGIKIPKII